MNEEANIIIDKISKISNGIKSEIKPLIIKLSRNIAQNIDHPEIKVMAKNLGIEEPKLTDIARIMNRIREKQRWAFGQTAMYDYIEPKFKDGKKDVLGNNNVVRLTDNKIEELVESYIADNVDIVDEQIKALKKLSTPAKDIITKARKEDMEQYTWKCHLANELALLAIKMENEHCAVSKREVIDGKVIPGGQPLHQHDDKLCKEYAKRTKLVRDSRFATDINSYEAIIVACNTTDSLKHAIAGEWEFKTVWEIRKDEAECRECIKERCEAEKCTHECHRVVRPMTTKGLKYAIKTNEDLKNLDKRIKMLTEVENDICRLGKILIENPKTKNKLGPTEIKKLMYNHVDREECLQCDLFLEKNPDFFEKMK